jgi:hypothetical protein
MEGFGVALWCGAGGAVGRQGRVWEEHGGRRDQGPGSETPQTRKNPTISQERITPTFPSIVSLS